MEITAQAWLHGGLLGVLCSQGDVHVLQNGKIRHTLVAGPRGVQQPTSLVPMGQGFLVASATGSLTVYGAVAASLRCALQHQAASHVLVAESCMLVRHSAHAPCCWPCHTMPAARPASTCRCVYRTDEAWYRIEAVVQLPTAIASMVASPAQSRLLVVDPKGRVDMLTMDAQVCRFTALQHRLRRPLSII